MNEFGGSDGNMAKAIWKDTVLADSEHFEIVEGNVYFPRIALRREYFRPSDTHTTCPWKGVASYYHVEVNGEINRDAAWYYPETTAAAKNIEGHVAFWRGVQVSK